MGGQLSQDNLNDLSDDKQDIINQEGEIKEPHIIVEQFTLNQKKEQIKVPKNNSQIKVGEYATSQIDSNNQSKIFLIKELKQEKSQIVEQKIQQPKESLIASQNILSNQSRIFFKNNPIKITDTNFQIQNHFPEWANKMIEDYGYYQCPEKINYENSIEAILQYEDGSYYKGQIQNYDRHGYGIYLQESELFEGYFEKNNRNGWGRELQQDILKQGIWKGDQITNHLEIRKQDEYYKGECQQGLPHGKGKLENKDYVYEGYFQKGLKHGKGQLKYKDNNDIYDGQFKDDKMDGYGKYYFSNKVVYEGNFKEGQITGKGEMRYPNDKFYRGDFLNGKMDGQGILHNGSGEQHDGSFKDGLKHGYGKTTCNGMTVTGNWERDALKEDDPDEQ